MKSCPVCSAEFADEVRTCPHHGVLLIGRRELAPGTIFRGTYRIVRVLGRGGMGMVYLAELILLGEMRALKFLAPELATNPGAVQRFLREAQKAAKIGLHQPNIVKTLALGQDDDGGFFIEMEYVDGPSLEALIEGAPKGLPVERALEIVRGIAKGLEAAHAKGMVHRDIKPGNILLGIDDHGAEIAKIADFGIVTGTDAENRLTRTGLQPLTPEYASPEQWKGVIPGHQLDGRTDIYALGCVFFEMLTGRVPFVGEDLREEHVHTPAPAPSSLRAELARWVGLDDVVLRMMAKAQEERFADVRGLVQALNKIALETEKPAELPAKLDEDVESLDDKFLLDKLYESEPESTKAARGWIWLAVCAFVLIIGGVIWFAPSHNPQNDTPHADTTGQSEQQFCTQPTFRYTVTPNTIGYDGTTGCVQFVSLDNGTWSDSKILSGRRFARSDYEKGAVSVAFITEGFAKRIFPGQSPLGRSIFVGGHETEIVGVGTSIVDKDNPKSIADVWIPATKAGIFDTFAPKPPPAPPGTTKLESSIVVTVVDPTGAPISQGKVTIATPFIGSTPFTEEGLTDTSGRCRFNKLLGGKYTVSVAAAGFATGKKDVQVGWGKTATVKFTLNLGS